jgi:hypothetical protein
MFLTYNDIDANINTEYPITEILLDGTIKFHSIDDAFVIISTENNKLLSWRSTTNNNTVNCMTLICNNAENCEMIAERCNALRCPYDVNSRYIIFYNPELINHYVEAAENNFERMRRQTFKIKKIMMMNNIIIPFFNIPQLFIPQNNINLEDFHD